MGTVHRLPSPPLSPLSPLPSHGGAFTDQRGDGRTLRVAWHAAQGIVVLSLWRNDACTGTFQMPASDLPGLMRALTDGPLADR